MASNLSKIDNSLNYNTPTETALTNIYKPSYNISQSLNGSIVSFFENITGERDSAEILASSVISSAIEKKINPVKLLDRLRNLTVQEQKYYLNYYLNTNRVGTSLLGSKKNAQVNKFVERSINYFNNTQAVVDGNNILLLDAGDELSYPGNGLNWFNLFGNNKFEFLPNIIYNNKGDSFFKFTGDNYATGPTNLGNFLTGDITVEVIIRINSYSTSWVRIVGAGTTSNRQFGLWYYNDGRILYQRIGDTTLNLFPNDKARLGSWYHIVATTHGNQHSLYLNNQLIGQTQNNAPWINLNHPITLAYSLFHSYGKFDINLVRIYNRSLNQIEIADSYVRARSKVTI